jgi:8-oxo-dGTP diphosphatase
VSEIAGDTRAPAIAVGAVVLDRTGTGTGARVLVVKRARPPRQDGWSLPGGRVERGERLADALRREIAEETGLHVRPGPLVAVVELIDGAHHYVILDYLCDRLGGELSPGDDATDAAFVPIEELRALGVTETVRDVVARALDMAGHRARGDFVPYAPDGRYPTDPTHFGSSGPAEENG